MFITINANIHNILKYFNYSNKQLHIYRKN